MADQIHEIFNAKSEFNKLIFHNLLVKNLAKSELRSLL